MTYDPLDWDYQYGRDDIDYETWYSDHAKRLAASYTAAELRAKLGEARDTGERYSRQWLNARNQQTNRVHETSLHAAAAGQDAMAIRSALEIHVLFPEHGKQEGGCDGRD
jgi:hypothetical protein